MVWNGASWVVEDNTPVSLEGLTSTITTYQRTVEGVAFTADDGVVLPGFSAGSGHVYGTSEGGPAYDYVRDASIPDTAGSYHASNSLKDITFQGLTISGGVSVSDYSSSAVNSGIIFDGCTFLGDESLMADKSYVAVKMSADSKYFSNVTVTNCTFTDYFQAVYIQGVDGAVIANNDIDGTTHNAIALQSSTGNPAKGTVEISENFIKNTTDRAIRVGDASAAFKLNAVNNIMVNAGDPVGELFKAQNLAEGSEVALENNYWDGRTPDEAVANEPVRPSATGITGGSFRREIAAEYCAEGFSPVENADGTFGVCNHANTEVKGAVAATCTQEGYTGDTVCADCGKVLETGSAIAKTAHNFVDGKCTVCGEPDPDSAQEEQPTAPVDPDVPSVPTDETGSTEDTSQTGTVPRPAMTAIRFCGLPCSYCQPFA